MLKLALATILAFLAPIQGMLITSGALIMLDLFFGIAASMKKGEKITSAGLRRTLVKLFVYEAAIILGYVTQKYLLADYLPLMNIITAFVGMTELLSIFENLNTISGQNLLQSLLEKLNSESKK